MQSCPLFSKIIQRVIIPGQYLRFLCGCGNMSMLLDEMLKKVATTTHLCRNPWSECLNRIPQHLTAICCRAEPMGSSSMRSATACRRAWKAEGRGRTASPPTARSLRGCSQTRSSASSLRPGRSLSVA